MSPLLRLSYLPWKAEAVTSYKGLAVTPFDYQKEGIDFGLLHHYHINADEMGLGKSLQSLAIAFDVVNKGGKVLVISPAFLRYNWFCEINKLESHLNMVHVIEGNKEAKLPIPKGTDFIIMGYAQIDHASHVFDMVDMVIIDEAHYIKNIDAKRTERLHELIYRSAPERLALLTGTPMPNGTPVELYSLLRMCGYTVHPTNGANVYKDYPVPWDFYEDYSIKKERTIYVKGRRRLITKYEGVRKDTVKRLKYYLKDKMIRRRAEKVLKLPPLMEKNVVVDYRNIPQLMEMFNEFNGNEKYSPELKAKSAMLKVKYTLDYVKMLDERKLGPFLIYSDHKKPVEWLAEKLGCPYIHGDIPVRKRDKYVSEFQRSQHNFLCITIGSGAEGMNLTNARHLVVNDPNWTPAKNDQMRKRFHRIGQEDPCTVHNIIGSVQDKRIIESLRKKMKVIGAVL